MIYNVKVDLTAELAELLKSVNLQYNTLGHLDDGTNEESTKRLMFQVLFIFHDFFQKCLQKYFQFILLFFLKNTKIKIESFECPKSIKNLILGTSDSWLMIR